MKEVNRLGFEYFQAAQWKMMAKMGKWQYEKQSPTFLNVPSYPANPIILCPYTPQWFLQWQECDYVPYKFDILDWDIS